MRAFLSAILCLLCLTPSRAETRFSPLDLSALLNNDAVATKDRPADGNFDAIGDTQPATFNFSEEGWPKEPQPDLGGVPFRLGSIAPGAKNNAIARGQSVPVPEGRYSALYVLAATTNGSYTGTWTLSYTDGPPQTVTARFSDWCSGPGPGEAVAIRSAYRYMVESGMTPDCAPMLYARRIDLDPERALTGITLPDQANTHVFALTLGAGDRVTPTGLAAPPPPQAAGPRVTLTSDAPMGTLVVPPGPVRLTAAVDAPGVSDVSIAIEGATAHAAEGASLSIPRLDAGYYPVRLRFVSEGKENVVSSGLAVVPDDAPPAWKPDSPFAMNAGFDQDDLAQAKKAAFLARRAGIRWVRQGFDWGHIESEPGQWRWVSFDRAMKVARDEKLLTLGLLAYWAGWSKPFTPEGYASYAAYARSVVGHFQDVPAWEVWNEPNIFYWRGTRDQYATLLKIAIPAIHEANPKSTVAGICTAFSAVPFIRGVLEAGARPDVVSVHPYRGAAPDTPAKLPFGDAPPDTLAGETRAVKGAVAEAAGTRPLWFTEVGWWTGKGGLSEREQADYLVQTYATALSEGVGKVFWYAFIDAGTRPGYDQDNFGILRNDLSPKPAYAAYATMARQLEGARFDRRLDLGDTVRAFRFRSGKGAVTVLWATVPAIFVQLPASRNAQALLWDGRPVNAPLKNGELSLDLSPSPLYIVER